MGKWKPSGAGRRKIGATILNWCHFLLFIAIPSTTGIRQYKLYTIT